MLRPRIARFVWHLVGIGLGLAAPAAWSQSSPSYVQGEHTFNSGGNPANGTVLTSPTFQITLDSIGDSVAAPVLSSTSYQIGGGFVPTYPPPGEVLNLRFSNPTTLTWNPEPSVGTYSVYRGALGSLPGGYGTCLVSALTSATTTDSTTPAPGTGYFYLITAENRLSEEGTKGKDSGGTPRPNPSPCP